MNLSHKIKSPLDLAKLTTELRTGRKNIVFTNGCFDLLHPGHLHYLMAAKQLGDILIVGINSDESIRKLKGAKRPVNSLQDRMELVAGLECVDYVTSFEEPDPYQLISLLKPHILVKGGDWAPDKIIGKDIVERLGGKVIAIPFTPGYSTTKLIEKIIERYQSSFDR